MGYTYTKGTAGNGLASQSLGAGASVSQFTLDFSAVDEAKVEIGATFGTIAATAGLQILVYSVVGSTPVTATVALPGPGVLKAVAGAQSLVFTLGTGIFKVGLTNLDATNGLTLVYCTYDTTLKS